jgi:hypothetical protein
LHRLNVVELVGDFEGVRGTKFRLRSGDNQIRLMHEDVHVDWCCPLGVLAFRDRDRTQADPARPALIDKLGKSSG